MLKKITVLLMVIYLTGCTTLSNSIKQEDLSRIDKIGIVSLVDDKIAYNYVGITIFNNENNLYPIDNWQLDQAIAETIEKTINESSTIPTTVVTTKGEWLATLYDTDGNYHFDIKKAKPLLDSIAKESGHRFLIVAHRDYMQFEGNVPVGVQGVGIRKRIGSDLVGAYAILEVKLIDTVTGKVLARGLTPAREQDSSLTWLEPFSAQSNTEQEKVKSKLKFMATDWVKRMSRSLVVPQQ